jgi:branched-subunit amino acid aminotransferase/4-amino-4-deoxychorismate lyase
VFRTSLRSGVLPTCSVIEPSEFRRLSPSFDTCSRRLTSRSRSPTEPGGVSPLAAAEISDGHHDMLMLDVADRIESGTSCNFFVTCAGRLATPKLDSAGVAGVVRGIVQREAPKLGLVVEERALTLADLTGADEVLITNARIGVVPVQRVGEHQFNSFELALRLRGHIEALDA